MFGGLAARPVVATAAIVVAAVAITLAAAPPDPDSPIVSIDAMTITRSDFEWYSQVFNLEDGGRLLPDEYILLALVNQALVIREADRLAITVPKEAVDARVEAAVNHPLFGRALKGETERARYRSLLERKLRFDAVKLVVTDHLVPTEQMVEAYYLEHREDYPLLELSDVSFEISTVLQAEMVATEWRRWLASERACADIKIVDTAFSLPRETYEGRCTPVPT